MKKPSKTRQPWFRLLSGIVQACAFISLHLLFMYSCNTCMQAHTGYVHLQMFSHAHESTRVLWRSSYLRPCSRPTCYTVISKHTCSQCMICAGVRRRPLFIDILSEIKNKKRMIDASGPQHTCTMTNACGLTYSVLYTACQTHAHTPACPFHSISPFNRNISVDIDNKFSSGWFLSPIPRPQLH